jgi:hypothetical protein
MNGFHFNDDLETSATVFFPEVNRFAGRYGRNEYTRFRLGQWVVFGNPFYLTLVEIRVILVGLLFRLFVCEFGIWIVIGAEVVWDPSLSLARFEGGKGHIPKRDCAIDELFDGIVQCRVFVRMYVVDISTNPVGDF